MDPLSATASVIAVLQLSSKVVGYLTDVKDASKERAKCAVEASNLHSLLLNLRFRLEEGNTDTPWYTAVRALAVENGPLDQFKQALELLQTKMTDGGRMKNAREKLLWKFKKEEVASILDRMERLKSTLEIALQMDHFKLSQVIETNTQDIKHDTASIRAHQDETEHRNLLKWVSPTDYPAQQSDIMNRRQEGTGQWFLDAPEVAKWRSEARATLFCPGIPGAGKTMTAAIAIESLLKSIGNSSIGVAYVYCNYKDQKDQDVNRMLAAILKQLVQGRPSLAEPLKRLYSQHAQKGTKPSIDEIFTTLQSVISDLSTVYIVLDALDECRNDDGTRQRLLARIRDLQSRFDVRLLTTSRFLPDIVDVFKDSVVLEVRASDDDVRRFVAGQIYRLPSCIQCKLELQILVQDKIAESVDGMFLLARLHTDSLLDKRTPKEIKATLARLSKGSAALDDAYKDAIHRIEGQLARDAERAKSVLSWITYAQRPLTTAELCCALAVEHEEEELDPENVLGVEELVSVCAGLVVVDEESRIVRLVHYTTQEYLERIRETWNPEAQLDIALTCLTYLSFNDFKNGSCSTEAQWEERLQQNVFLDYAARYWGPHALPVEDKVYGMACLFLLHEGSVSCATQAMSMTAYEYDDYKQFPHNRIFIHVTARFGLARLLKRLLESTKEDAAITVKSQDSYGQDGLYIAAEYGHDETVKLLLDKGANPNAQGGEYGNALQAASYRGHQAVVKMLLDAGADVNAQGGEYGNALQAASEGGHEAVVKLLLDVGADVNAQGGEYGNALQAASGGGHEAVVKLLLDVGADVNAQGGGYGNALQAASEGGHEAVVKLLLDVGADVNAQGGRYGNAIQAASEEGHEAVVRLLLDKGADPNAKGKHYNFYYLFSSSNEVSYAIQAASSGGHEAVVKLLLEGGANPNTQGGYHGNALQAASYRGHQTVVKVLLDAGADVNAQGGRYGNAIHAASKGGHEAVVKVLLDAGADVNAKAKHYNPYLFPSSKKESSALQAASLGRYEAVVKMLLDAGADVNAQGGEYGNALRAALLGGNEAVVKLLEASGAK